MSPTLSTMIDTTDVPGRKYVTCDLDLTLCDTAIRDAELDPFNPANQATADPAFWEDSGAKFCWRAGWAGLRVKLGAAAFGGGDE